MKLTHIQVFKKVMHEAGIKCVCLQADTQFFLWIFFLCSDIHITKYIQINKSFIYQFSPKEYTYEYTTSIHWYLYTHYIEYT